MTIEARFWAKVDKTDTCWLWTAGTVKGYGQLSRGRRGEGMVYAHRFSWELVNGPIPSGLQIDHRPTCPKTCVRPDHLRLVQKDLEKQFQADVEAIETQWQEAQPLVQKMLSDWREINEREMLQNATPPPREGERND